MLIKNTWVWILAAAFSMSLCFSGLSYARGSSGGFSGGFSSSRSSGGSWGGGSRSSGGGWGSGGKSSYTTTWGSTGSGSKSSTWGSSGSKSSGGVWGTTTVTPVKPTTTVGEKGSDKSKGWGSTSDKTSPSGMALGGRNATKSTNIGSDKALYEKAKMSGTAFKTREEAVKDFQTKNAAKYTTNFTTEPKVRPAYIPTSTTIGGRQHVVIYSPQYGGYGYFNDGSWVAYSVMRDAAMMSTLMNQNHYYYGPTPVVVSSGPTLGSIFLYIIICLIIIMVIVTMVRR
jgi:hypothetical protein